MNFWRPDFSRRSLARMAVVTILYVLAGKLGLQFAIINPSVSAVWPAAGIALAALLLLKTGIWPAIALGSFIVNVSTSGAVVASLVIAAGNTLEGLIGAMLVERYANGINAFDRAADILNFTIVAPMLSTMVAATIGVSSLCLLGSATWSTFRSLWLTWWVGDMGGELVLTPLIILWSLRRRWKWSALQVVEGVGLLIGIILLGLAVFGGVLPPQIEHYPFEIINIPVIIWAALRFDQREIATGTFILSAITIGGTLLGYGPFVRTSHNDSLLLADAFVGITSLMAISAGAVVSERRRLMEELEEALTHVKTLTGLLPICAWCKRIRNDRGYWEEVEAYIHEHSEVAFSHGICPDCMIRYKSEVLKRRRNA